MRHALVLTFLALVVATLPAQQPALTHGPIRGHADATSLHVWARASTPGEHRLQLRELGRGTAFEATATASEANDLTLRFAATGLPSGGVFGARILHGDAVVFDAPDAGWTTGLSDDARAATVAFGSCASDKGIPTQPIWGRILARRPHALALLGDTPYIDSGDREARRRRHQDFFALPPIAATLRQIPTWTTWDDHDYALNDQFGAAKASATAREVFVDYHAHASYGDGARGVYTRFRQGPIEVYLLDPRSFADTEPSPLAPGARTALGGAQVAWLQQGLRASTAAVKVLACGMVWNGAVRPGKKDCWGNWPDERDALFRWLGEAGIDGVVLVSGDVHRSRVIVHPTRKLAGYDLPEFVTSPLAQNVLEENAVPLPGLRFDAGEPHSCLFLDVVASPETADGGRLRATFQAGDGREFHVEEFALSQLAGPDAAAAYRAIAGILHERHGPHAPLPELAPAGEADADGTVSALGPEWRGIVRACEPQLAAWRVAAELSRCRFAARGSNPQQSEFLADLMAPLLALARLGDASGRQAVADRARPALERAVVCQLALARHLRSCDEVAAWVSAAECERTAAALVVASAPLGDDATKALRARLAAQLEGRPSAVALASTAGAQAQRDLARFLAKARLGADAAAETARTRGAAVRDAFAAELAPVFAAAEGLGGGAEAAGLAAVERAVAALQQRAQAQRAAMAVLRGKGPAAPDAAATLGLQLATLLLPDLAGLARDHATAGEALQAAAR